MQNKVIKADNYVELYNKLFDINKIKVHPRKKIWELYIKPKELIDVKELESIEAELAQRYALSKVKLIISQEAKFPVEQIKITECKEDIMTRVIKDNPGFIGFK